MWLLAPTVRALHDCCNDAPWDPVGTVPEFDF
jgi:hypothetical protein